MRGLDPQGDLPAIVQAHLRVMKPETIEKAEALELIAANRLPWEALPTEANTDPDTWVAMLPSLGLGAVVRNLGTMTRLGAIKPLSDAEHLVVQRFGDEAAIRQSRLHPFAILQAMAIYGSGHGFRGSQTWSPSQAVLDALDGAFYKAFANVRATGKRHLIGIDVSHSMNAKIMNSAVQCNVAAGALALVTASIESRTHIMMFDQGMRPANITPKDRLDAAVKKVSCINGGGTDCALPMLYALEKGLEVDAFVVLTDNETWAGNVHPSQALAQYRKKTGIPAKLIVVGMTSTGFSIADPNDAGMLDVVGFDAGAPLVMADFVR
jgi:60 kDa SS-A/Ro ribonucleoprotein